MTFISISKNIFIFLKEVVVFKKSHHKKIKKLLRFNYIIYQIKYYRKYITRESRITILSIENF